MPLADRQAIGKLTQSSLDHSPDEMSLMIDFREVREDATGERVLEVPFTGLPLLDCPLFNKGSAFPEQERHDLGLLGLLPPHVGTLDEQTARRYREYRQKTTDLDRHIFLRALQDRNETLFYRLLQDHLPEMLPVIYTPVVGEACQQFSRIYRKPRGLFCAYPDRAHLDTILAHRPYRDVDVIVVTDGERILGLGDQGTGGMGIPVGKLSLYTLCGGIHPGRTLPILLDVGTDNAELLADPLYLGWKHPRVRGSEYDAFIESFIEAVRRQLPDVLLQWEDFGLGNARRLLVRYRERLCSFNDDIQGTAATALGVLLAAARVAGVTLAEQRLVIVGAGSAGTGIADMMVSAMTTAGLTERDARARLWLVDRQGLLSADMPGLNAEQQRYATAPERLDGWARGPGGGVALAEVVRRVRPTALVGVCGQPGVFTEEVVRAMAAGVQRPVILPLSNPTARSEALPVDLLTWTEGRALVATGSPFADVVLGGRVYQVAQCNNTYVFPGLGLGVIASGARRVTDEMLRAVALALAECAPAWRGSGDALLPPLRELPQVARAVALAVGMEAQRQGLAQRTTREELERRVDAHRWEPHYLPMRARTRRREERKPGTPGNGG
jgi:malate dehydrogenase (oxaloacetate-decarboxylating)